MKKHQLPRPDESGASAVEYGLLIAGIAALVVVAIFTFGHFVEQVFGDSCDTVSGKITQAECP